MKFLGLVYADQNVWEKSVFKNLSNLELLQFQNIYKPHQPLVTHIGCQTMYENVTQICSCFFLNKVKKPTQNTNHLRTIFFLHFDYKTKQHHKLAKFSSKLCRKKVSSPNIYQG